MSFSCVVLFCDFCEKGIHCNLFNTSKPLQRTGSTQNTKHFMVFARWAEADTSRFYVFIFVFVIFCDNIGSGWALNNGRTGTKVRHFRWKYPREDAIGQLICLKCTKNAPFISTEIGGFHILQFPAIVLKLRRTSSPFIGVFPAIFRLLSAVCKIFRRERKGERCK